MGLYEKNILGRENNLNQMKAERYNISWHSMRIASNLIWLKHGTEKKESKGARREGKLEEMRLENQAGVRA